jgi:hypothetical protein
LGRRGGCPYANIEAAACDGVHKKTETIPRGLQVVAANSTGFAVLPVRKGTNNLHIDEVAQAPRQGKIEREFF